MGIYIKGFIPTDGLYQIQDGVIRKYKGKGGTVRPYELVEVKEPHGRLIDADALLERWCSEVCKAKPRCDEDCMFYDYLTLDSLSPTIEPEPHWIPISERLPDEEKKVYWVCTDGGYQFQCRWTNINHFWTDLTTDWHWHIMDVPQYSKVIAWRPLPPVYQKEDNK